MEASTPGPSPNPSLNPSLNLSLSLSSIQFILFYFLNPDLNLIFLNLDLNLNLYGGVLLMLMLMLMLMLGQILTAPQPTGGLETRWAYSLGPSWGGASQGLSVWAPHRPPPPDHVRAMCS